MTDRKKIRKKERKEGLSWCYVSFETKKSFPAYSHCFCENFEIKKCVCVCVCERESENGRKSKFMFDFSTLFPRVMKLS